MLITSGLVTSALNPKPHDAVTPVIGVDAAALRAIQPHLTDGRLFDDGAVRRGDSVALVPASQAQRLGVGAVGDSVSVAGRRFWVLGLFDDVGRRPETLAAILVPGTVLPSLPKPPMQAECRVVVETASGAASQVAAQIAATLDPGRPSRLIVSTPPDPTQFRRSLEGPVQQLSLVLSLVMLLLGVLSIAFSANSSVNARTAEFGLRQSLGATPGAIGAQVILENLFLGLLGGTIGAYLGAATVLGVALANGWSPVLDLGWTITAATACGLLGAVVPAIRAARLNPVDALRA